jgi:hypothetical protein
VPSKNFPDAFFVVGPNDEFDPSFATNNSPAEEPDNSGPVIDWAKGHGTHVAGIILGGMYDDNEEPEGSNVKKPNARTLLLDKNSEKSWLHISFLTISYGSDAPAEDPVTKLNDIAEDVDKIPIVNMSLAKELTGAEDNRQLTAKNPLIVTSAGNSGLRLGRSRDGGGVAALPASLRDDGRILVVASHDANGKLSEFSNFGRLVNIAAPGCQIKSWIDGNMDAVPLSGTSMATAIVTFAAALVRSQWKPRLGAAAIRNRILASAQYIPALQRCFRVVRENQGYCVKDGAMLDIPAAVNVSRDLIEFDECGSATAPCKPTIALGTVERPEPLLSCMADDDLSSTLNYQDLSFNSAFKRVEPGKFLVQYESGWQVGEEQLNTKPQLCDLTSVGDAEINFVVEGPQLDGRSVASSEPKRIPVKNLIRLVTRVN